MIRLQKVLAHAGVGSRRACEQLILEGRVTVDGRPATLGESVDADRCVIAVDGRRLAGAEALVHLALHKPRHCVTSVHDPQGRPTVLALVASIPQRIYPVGRLDFDSEGLLLMTNDGALANALLHPGRHVPRTYHVEVAPPLPDAARQALRRGVELDDGRTLPARVRVLGSGTTSMKLEVILREGRNRQIRRMIEAVGSQVRRLVRVAMGSVELGSLPSGTWRWLTPEEVERLRLDAQQDTKR